MLRHLLGFLAEEILQSLHLDDLVVQPAPLHGRDVLSAELVVSGCKLRVAPPQLLQRRHLLLVII